MSLENFGDTLLKKLNSLAREKNIYLISRLQESKVKSLEVVNGEINEVNSGQHSGLGLHLFDQQGHSILTSTDKLNDNYVSKLFERSAAQLKKINCKATKTPAIFDLEKNKDSVDLASEFAFNFFTTQELKEKLLQHNRQVGELAAKAEIDNKISVRTLLQVKKQARRLTRIDGTDIFWSIPSCRLSTVINLNTKENKIADYVTRITPDWEILTDKRQLEDFYLEVRNVLDLLKSSADKPQYPAGNYPLLIDSKLGGLLAHEAFGHAAESDSILSGESILSKDKKLAKGRAVASEKASIIDQARKYSWGYTPYSSFGVAREKVEIVKDGKLNASLSDISSGRRIGDKVYGCARTESYEDIPIPRMSNTFISVKQPFPGFNSYPKPAQIRDKLLQEDLLNDKVLLLHRCFGGGQVDPHSGTFMFNFNYLYELTPSSVKLYRGSSFSGNILEALKSVKAGFGGVKIHQTGVCGKRGQTVPTASGSNQFLLIDQTPAVMLGGS
ncbi:MAG: TldD/PmbA family protein [Patescibacteria group bacterium]